MPSNPALRASETTPRPIEYDEETGEMEPTLPEPIAKALAYFRAMSQPYFSGAILDDAEHQLRLALLKHALVMVINRLRAQNEALLSRVTSLERALAGARAAFGEYAAHTHTCRSASWGNKECDCGLDATAARLASAARSTSDQGER